MLIGNDCVVSIQYVLKNDQGEVMDESQPGEPLSYLHGAAGIVPGLEKELTGKTAGGDFDVTITPEEAYGERQEALVQQVPASSFPSDPAVEPGMQFQAETEGGPMMVMVTEVTDETVTVDGNHPLAGHILNFTGKVEEVRMATAEELDHGHVH